MFQQLVAMLPRDIGSTGAVIALAGSLMGLALWLVGARFSRSLVTLALVGFGTAFGARLPDWFGWNIDDLGPAVVTAILLGFSGFFADRFWLGAMLGLIISAWAALALWVALGHAAGWNWPDYASARTIWDFLGQNWRLLPGDVRRYLPFVIAILTGSAIALALAWPRLGAVLAWSAMGMSMFTGMIATVISRVEPDMPRGIPRQTWLQASILAGLTAMAAVVQWRLTRSPARPPVAAETEALETQASRERPDANSVT